MMVDKEERKRIGQDIATLRKENNMTQEQLSRKTGILRNHLSRIERGRYSVGFDTLNTIARALGKRIGLVSE